MLIGQTRTEYERASTEFLPKRVPRRSYRGSPRVALYRAIFPQMTFLLPENETAQFRFEFETELARLDAA
jgi:hypothetical protein